MKITNVRPWITKTSFAAREYIFVQVETDEGISGWGEVTTYPGPVANRAVAGMITSLNDLVKGDNPLHTEAVWHKVFRAFTYLGTRGAACAATSAIDIALWDIKGKALGLPVYELLGGPVRDTIPLYTHPPEAADPKIAARDAKEIVKAGYKAFKFDPFMHGIFDRHTGYLDGSLDDRTEQEGVEITAAVREAVGPGIEILIDAHAMYNVPTAIRLCDRLKPFNIGWFEEPVPPESYHALQQVREATGVRMCVGERLHTRWEFLPILEKRLADFIMPDVTWTGGITELKKIATLAETYYIPVSPHDASGPVNVLAGAHVMATTPNFYRLETSRADLSMYNEFIEEPLNIKNGELIIPDKPGLGVEFNMDYLKKNPSPGVGAWSSPKKTFGTATSTSTRPVKASKRK
ncbi:MAG: mandelate racemase/muconate lactonizing enzyme family protein [Dehalococcoidia bacterium]|nr:mandelate racemase/muconate lactonizing enzyme family protein [Dehalococcoidia bacterium]